MNNNWVKQLPKVDTTKTKYSQYGEAAIIDFIFKQIGIKHHYFVEFGAGDGHYLSNTRHLLDAGWQGLMMDGDNKGSTLVHKEWITAENINQLFTKHDVPLVFDLLSLDIDGNDYWVWKNLAYRPRVVVCEFNGTIDRGVSKTIQYDPKHSFKENDHYGFSFEAGRRLGMEKGYTLVHQNMNTNMFFVLSDIVGTEDFGVDYVPTRYWGHDPNGKWVTV